MRATVRTRGPLIAVAVAGLLLSAVGSAEASYAVFHIRGVGAVPGTDYDPLVSSETIDLDSAELVVFLDGSPFCDAVPSLPNGQVYTLVSTTGGLTGAFTRWSRAEIHDGDVVEASRNCFLHERLGFQIHYDDTGPVQTVTGTVVDGSPTPVSATTLSLPASAETNEPVTITATVRVSSGTPAGTVSFGTTSFPAPGCANRPLIATGDAFEATCQSPFRRMPMATSPRAVNVTARFTPSEGAAVRGSEAGSFLPIYRSTTATSVETSSATARTDESITATATVTPMRTGPFAPTGSVEFLDGGAPIPSCAQQPIVAVGDGSVATCDIDFAGEGSHAVTARYLADDDFAGSTSPPQEVTVSSPPPPPPPSDGPAPDAQRGSPAVLAGPIELAARPATVLAPAPLSLVSRRIAVTRTGGALVRVACRHARSCDGRVVLRTRGADDPTVLGSARVSLAAGRHVAARIRLASLARRLMRERRGTLYAELTLLDAAASAPAHARVRLARDRVLRSG